MKDSIFNTNKATFTPEIISKANGLRATVNGIDISGMVMGVDTYNNRTVVDIKTAKGARFVYINQINCLY